MSWNIVISESLRCKLYRTIINYFLVSGNTALGENVPSLFARLIILTGSKISTYCE